MTTKRSKSSILLAILVLMIGVIAVILTASQIKKKPAMEANEIEVNGLVTEASSVDTRYATHIGESGEEVYDALMYQTIEMEYSVDNKKQEAKLNDMVVYHQETEDMLDQGVADLYAEECAYALGDEVPLYVSTDDLSKFRIVEVTGSLSLGLAIVLIVLEILVAGFILYKLVKHTISVMFKFC